MELTDGRGADVVFDLVGGDCTETHLDVRRPRGSLPAGGLQRRPRGGLTGKPLRKVSIGNFSVLGVMLVVQPTAGRPMRRFGMNPFPPEIGPRGARRAAASSWRSGAIRPAIGRRIRMDEVAAALEDHEHRRTQRAHRRRRRRSR